MNQTTRRTLLGGLGGAIASPALLHSQQDPEHPHPRVPGIDEMVHVTDFESVFFDKLPRATYTYTAYGSEGEFTLHRNRQAYSWADFIPRTPLDIKSIDTATEVLGTKMAFPIMASPSATHGALEKDGELSTYRGATAASNTPMIVSGNATFAIDKIAAASTGPLWLQLYPRQDPAANRKLVEDGLKAGCRAVVATVDQTAAYYERPQRERHLLAAAPITATARPFGGGTNPYRVSENRLWYSWKLVEEMKTWLKVPLILKGIVTAEDTRLAIEHGVDAVYVSNHGGRSLDYEPATLEVLPEIVVAAQGRVPILFDGGIRSGDDILKALALGAKAVCLGRAIRWGLGAYGAPGVQRVLEILQNQLVAAMARNGRPSLASLDPSLLKVNFR